MDSLFLKHDSKGCWPTEWSTTGQTELIALKPEDRMTHRVNAYSQAMSSSYVIVGNLIMTGSKRMRKYSNAFLLTELSPSLLPSLLWPLLFSLLPLLLLLPPPPRYWTGLMEVTFNFNSLVKTRCGQFYKSEKVLEFLLWCWSYCCAGVPAVVKYRAWLQLWLRAQLSLRFDPWPENFHLLHIQPKKEKEKCLLKCIEGLWFPNSSLTSRAVIL